MDEITAKFITEIVKPWDSLNAELGAAFSMNPEINDFTAKAHSLAVAIKHFPEASIGIKIKDLLKRSRSYEIISDLADTYKHGALRDPGRECKLVVGSMFERNSDAKVRFLRNRISVEHKTYGRIDFMEYSLECALMLSKELNMKIEWSPRVLNNSGSFSYEIAVHASTKNQVASTGMRLEFVQLDDRGAYIDVDLNGTIEFVLTSEF